MTREEYNVEQSCTKILLEIGIPINLQGFRFLRTAILCVVNEPDIMNKVTKQLYPTVAQIYKVTDTVIERSVRHAIDMAYIRKGFGGLNKLFGIEIYENKAYKPSNSELIALIGEKLISDIKGSEIEDPDPENDNNDK